MEKGKPTVLLGESIIAKIYKKNVGKKWKKFSKTVTVKKKRASEGCSRHVLLFAVLSQEMGITAGKVLEFQADDPVLDERIVGCGIGATL